VDEEFHDLGSIPYKFRLDPEFAQLAVDKCKERGLHARTVSYYGFPIDIGSILALKLLNPDNRLPAIIVSSNMYANRAETIVLGKSVRDAIDASGKKAVVVVVSALSNRLHTLEIKPEDDKIHSLKDHEWNLKFLEYLDKGRLEDVSQLSRQFHEEARVPKVVSFKPFWIMASMMGQTNLYEGNILAYEPVWGTGSAVVTMTPAEDTAGDLEYDEDDPEFYKGDREVLDFYEQPGMGPLEEEDGD
jgi:aromatic ring-opening dioxygenase catalytic subunit (LigB family)